MKTSTLRAPGAVGILALLVVGTSAAPTAQAGRVARATVRYTTEDVASVGVRNLLGEPVHLWLSGKYCGRALPRGAVLCSRIPTGRRVLVAKATVVPYPELVRRTVEVGTRRILFLTPPPPPLPAAPPAFPPAPQVAPIVVLPPVATPLPALPPPMPVAGSPVAPAVRYVPLPATVPGGRLRVENRRSEWVRVWLDGRLLGVVQPAQTRSFPSPAGRHRAVAKSPRGAVVGVASVVLPPGGIHSWMIRGGRFPDSPPGLLPVPPAVTAATRPLPPPCPPHVWCAPLR